MNEIKKDAPEVPVQEQEIININEIRLEHGLEPIPYGDIDFTPIKQSDN